MPPENTNFGIFNGDFNSQNEIISLSSEKKS
jgi:hypothetical protein